MRLFLKQWKMECFSLLNYKKLDTCKLKITFYEKLVWKLTQVYDGTFDYELLKDEAAVL